MLEKFQIKKWIIHATFWLIFYMLLVLIFSVRSSWEEAFLRNGVFLAAQACVFYFNLIVLLPKLLERKKYLLYSVAIIGIIAVFVGGLHVVDDYLLLDQQSVERRISQQRERTIPKEIRGRHREIHKRHVRYRKMFKHGRIVMQSISMFGVLFLSTVVRNVGERQRREKERVLLENKALEAEFKFLKSQINPHFLFNSLNNIYALSQMESPKTPDAIYRLSQMLRYVLYESEAEKVEIEKEIEYVKNFIDLNLLKDQNIANVKVDINIDNNQSMVAPMIFIPYIENAFKHSRIEDTENGWIQISLSLVNKKLDFVCSNSIPEVHQKDEVGGVGIENVKRRLQLLYPNQHSLSIHNDGKKYDVNLSIQLA